MRFAFSTIKSVAIILLLAAPLSGSVALARAETLPPVTGAASTPPPEQGVTPVTTAAATPVAPPAAITPQPAPIAAKVAIMPHRAIYKMTLSKVKNGSNITDASGRMMFEWSDACDGWAVQQHLQLHFAYAEGDETDVNSTVVSWESKDGKRYNFNVRRLSNGKETEVYRGKASTAADGTVTVRYTEPEVKEVKFDPGTLFPSAHTILMLQKAVAGDRLFSRRVFDGSDEDGANDISAFLGSEMNKMEKAELTPNVKNALLDEPTWPIRMAFFKLKTETGEPDYEMNLSLLSNGVAQTMQIDYGDFSVSGTLTDLEPLPASGCD